MNVCVVGSTMIDLVARVPRLPKLGETLAGSSFTIGYGGKGGNQAVMAAKLGAAVTIVTRIGNDAFAAGALENYRALGIDVRHVVQDAAHACGVAPILVDDEAHNVVVIVPGANDALDAADVAAAAPALAAADVVVCQLEVPVATVIAAFAAARAAGALTVFNPAPARAVPDELWPLADIVVPNETEAETFTGIAVADDAGAEAAARALLARGAGAAIVTLGRRGSIVVSAAGVLRLESPVVEAVDPTGAGDAFIGTLAVCLAARMPLGDAARLAGAVAALSVTRAGTQTSFPDARAAAAFVAERGWGLRLPPPARPAADVRSR